MSLLIDGAQRYLADLLPGDVSDVRALKLPTLPYFLQDAFELGQLRVHGHEVVLAAAKTAQSQQTLHRMLSRLRDAAQSRVLYVAGHLTSYERKRLLSERVEFVVPDSQLHAPSLALDLRERPTTSAPRSEVLSLGPATQAVLLTLLLNDGGDMTTRAIARKLGYSPMTASRANRELEAAGLVRVYKQGSSSMLALAGSRSEMWAHAKPLMRSPVTKELHLAGPVPERTGLKLAGESALAELTLLSPPAEPVFAIGPSDWRTYGSEFNLREQAESDTFKLQIWSYNPWLWENRATVDPLSLTLSLQDVFDDRVQIALDELESSAWERSSA
ncbi:winged helix-turn-helix transcriptional regulator [Stenotrophomonas sp. PS02289]|uniref:helix-turn-helix transcriptional regulator n=1 Tax=Stenotrophomonas sp. PS02289 TaxID=2991422 RepID=UPI00249CF234|nr:winged helix-turn-helix transcriptional regulator [Stenotrophomonas sp. PS02289]